MATKFEISSFLGDERLVARRAVAGDVFSFLTRSLVLPPDCAAMVWPDVGSPRVAGPGSSVDADGAVRLMFVRNTPFALRYEFDRLTSADGFELSASVGFQIKVVAERTELAGFCDRLMGSAATVTLDALQSHCAEAVHAAVVAFVKARKATTLLSPQP